MVRWMRMAAPAAALAGACAAGARYAGLVRRWDPAVFSILPSASGPSPAVLKLHAPGAASVSAAGDFNGWAEVPMKKDDRGDWEARLDLPPGLYRYVFHVDDQWMLDPAVRRVDKLGPLSVSARQLP